MSSGFDIRVDDLSGRAINALLEQHLAHMYAISPPESVHALEADGLREPGVTVWTAWEGEELLGCAALKELDAGHGEIKSMRTADQHVGRGVASALLKHIVAVATERGYTRLSLETGSTDAFLAARSLYARYGFSACGPFADYAEDPHSSFMTRKL